VQDTQAQDETNPGQAQERNNDEARDGNGRRSRDRYGRERGPRADRAPREGDELATAQDAAPVRAASSDEAEFTPRPSYFSHVAQETDAAPAQEAAVPTAVHAVQNNPAPAADVVAAPVAVAVQAPAASVAAAPESVVAAQAPAAPAPVQFVLPVDTLHAVAQSSGLQWVGSNPDKVAAVQAAIAAEPAPAHVPRERPAPVVLEQAPLVLVETKRDLGQMQLPIA
jgi:ribonuclease E